MNIEIVNIYIEGLKFKGNPQPIWRLNYNFSSKC